MPELDLVFNNGFEPDGHGSEARLFRSESDGMTPTKLDQLVDVSDDCWRQQQLRPTELHDGRLGYIQVCNGRSPGSPVIWTVHAFDPKSGELEQWLRFDHTLRTFSWDGASTLYFSIGAGICGGIGTASGDDVVALSGVVQHAGQTLDLAAAYASETNSEPDCPDIGRVDHPAVSPDGQTLAFMVSFSTTSGTGRLDAPWDVFLRDLASGETSYLSGGITDPTDFGWSPSGQWLTLAAEINNERALWLIDPSSGDPSRFSSADALSFAWAPDGRQIAVAEQQPGSDLPTRLVLFEAGTVDIP